MSKNTPVHEVKFGRVRATVWANEGEAGIWHTVKFSRLYKDKEGKWQDADGFSREDLPLLIKAADQVHTFLFQAVGRDEPEELRGKEPM
jgi:hypothetical protein